MAALPPLDCLTLINLFSCYKRSWLSLCPLVRERSVGNGRVFFSNYFLLQKSGKFQPAEKSGLRHYAKIYVLGDRRPYTIEVQVLRQRRSGPGEYYSDGSDERIAKVVAKVIQDNLNKRPEDLNIIDDFRVF